MFMVTSLKQYKLKNTVVCNKRMLLSTVLTWFQFHCILQKPFWFAGAMHKPTNNFSAVYLGKSCFTGNHNCLLDQCKQLF